jgi:hypothetical protein
LGNKIGSTNDYFVNGKETKKNRKEEEDEEEQPEDKQMIHIAVCYIFTQFIIVG